MSEWRDYQKLVLAEIAYLRDDNKDIKEALDELRNSHSLTRSESKLEIALLKVKSSFWGTIGGALSLMVYLFFHWVSSKIKT